jgi:DNA-binding CsgD family transcriptional regulator
LTERLDAIARRMHAGPGLEDALDLLKRAGEAVGLPLPAVIDDITSNTPPRDAAGRRLNEVLGWPAWMIDEWYGRAYTRQHPIYLRCRFETRPFPVVHRQLWAEAGALTAAQQHMKRDQENLGVHGGIVVPVHMSLGRTGTVNWSSWEATDLERIIAAEGALLLSIAHGFMNVLQPPPRPRVGAGDLAHLTDRQVDCLTWLASGKTIAETAVILEISAHTVREHLRAVSARLGAVNTTHAVALACQFGIVAPQRP